MRFGLRFKFITVIFVSVVLVAGPFLWFFISQQRTLLTDELVERGKILSENLARNSEYGILTEDKVLLRQLIRSVEPHKDLIYVEIMDVAGKILTSYYPLGYPKVVVTKENRVEDKLIINYTTSLAGEPIYDFLVPVWLQTIEEAESDWFIEKEPEEITESKETKTDKIGFVHVGIDLKSTYHNIDRMRNFSILTFGLVYILLAIIFSLFFNRVVVKPIQRFTIRAEAISSGDFERKININRSDEIGQLADSFDSMAENLKNDINIIKDSEKKLKEYSELLEDRVEERTNELEKINLKLLNSIDKVKESDRMKSVFLANMSHELRTPLNSIIGFTGMILMGMAGDLSDEQKKQLTMVKKSGQHLLNLINDILDISKVEAGKTDILPEDFNIDDVIQEVIDTVTPLVNQKEIKILKKISEKTKIFSDRKRVKQILMNLASNAVKFTDQGNVKIESKVLKNGLLELRVIDTGIGIKKKDRSWQKSLVN